ncbi:hypothetical protein CspHIS471_0402760 [Cutaneotrichosporon sp. HIS471]|nr:hypothetical protein CspHIS471_0402760 [Cutaneotrichosporon sp. HIS471]
MSGMSNGKRKGKLPKPSNPRPALPHEPKLRFSSIVLDAKYDDYPVLTRMWLSIRDSNDTDKWITYHNLTVLLDFACWALPHAWVWLSANQRAMYLVLSHLSRKILLGLGGALHSWGQYALLRALEEQRVSWGLLPLVVGSALESVQQALGKRYSADRDELETLLDESSRSVMFNIHLRLSVPQSNDPLVIKLLKDTEPYTAFGFTSRALSHPRGRTATATGILRDGSSFLMDMVEMFSQLYLVAILLFTGKGTPVLASFCIILVQHFVTSSSTARDRSRKQRIERKDIDNERHALFDIAGSSVYRQESNLFQIGRHLGPTWEALSEKAKALSVPILLNWRDGLDVAFNSLLTMGPTIMKLAIVVKPSVGMRLSSIKITDDAAEWISNKFGYGFEYEHMCLRSVLEGGCSALAFCAAVDLLQPQEGCELVDYDDYRRGVGMRIEAKSLNFTYGGCDAPTLHDINLDIEPGATLAIVGFNGSGKTTLLRLLLGLMGMEGTTGVLQINGLPVDQYKASTLFNRMSCCFQEHAKFPESLRFNLGVGDIDRFDNDDALVSAAKTGGIEYLQEELGGFDRQLNPTDVRDMNGKDGNEGKENEGEDESGKTAEVSKEDETKETDKKEDGDKKKKDLRKRSAASLSRGQWQRIAIGRAFLKTEINGGVDLCVYDEPTASLDPVAEHDLMERISSLSRATLRRITTIFVSHRLASVRRADQIAFMEKGRIVELGTHAELLTLKGKYYQFWELHSKAYQDDSGSDDGHEPATTKPTGNKRLADAGFVRSSEV